MKRMVRLRTSPNPSRSTSATRESATLSMMSPRHATRRPFPVQCRSQRPHERASTPRIPTRHLRLEASRSHPRVWDRHICSGCWGRVGVQDHASGQGRRPYLGPPDVRQLARHFCTCSPLSRTPCAAELLFRHRPSTTLAADVPSRLPRGCRHSPSTKPHTLHSKP